MNRKPAFLVITVALLLSTACTSIATQPAAANFEATALSATKSMPVNTPQSPLIELPPGARLGSVLTGSGAVERKLLTFDDLMTGGSVTPLDNIAFALPEAAAMPAVVFEGRLHLSVSGNSDGYKVIRDDQGFASDPARLQLPGFDLEFVQDGSYLIPVIQGLVFSGDPYWNYIVGPGRIWQENGDAGYARASFPFALVERNQNCTHNGVVTFLFDGKSVSPVRYQVTQETCLYFKFDLWGRMAATYTPKIIPNAAAIKSEHALEVSRRLPTKPISALAADYPTSGVDLARLGSGITPEHLTAYGLVIDGINYVSPCRTRYGDYPYCEDMRLPSYSTAKSAFASVALMRLGQKYGVDIYSQLIKDYVPEAGSAAGDWSTVTFENSLDMATGNYRLPGFEVDESSPLMTTFLDESETYQDKIKAAFSFPSRIAPGQEWVYHTSDTFILTRAMSNYLLQKEDGRADIFNLVRDEVYIPLQLSAGALTTLRTDNNSTGTPFGGYGLFWTSDDIAKIALLLNSQNGNINKIQILEPGMLAATLQRDPENRGLNTTGVPVYKYNHGFWAKEWTPSENRSFSCSFWTPFMSGYGGITVVLMPNGSIYYYFSDNNEFSWYDAVKESNKLIPMCP
jgi:hypothetical protein